MSAENSVLINNQMVRKDAYGKMFASEFGSYFTELKINSLLLPTILILGC